MSARTKIGIVVGVVMLVGIIALLARRGREAAPSTDTASARGSDASLSNADRGAPGDADAAAAQRMPARAVDGNVRLAAKWGSGKDQLGHERPQEGNPEGPMSFALAGDGMVVLDQVNGRLAKYDAKGRLERMIDTGNTVQDVAVAKDGSIAALDRLSQKNVALFDPNGRKIAELPLTGDKLSDTGLTTGVFVDGKDVYVEKEHGALIQIGTIDGRPAEGDKELSGRPSKDGALLLNAVLPAPRNGRAVVNAFDRKSGALRFARAVQFPPPAEAIVLLDSDAQGTIYLGVTGGPSPGIAEIACMDPGDGHVLGRVDVQVSATPDESFRDFAVGGDGTIVYALRSEEGVEYRTARCP